VCEQAGDHPAAAGAAAGLLQADPTDEGAHRARMRALARAARRAHALRQFLRCRRALADAFEAEPDGETVRLRRAILAGTRRDAVLEPEYLGG
jgi:DNA-binding SARP family transcriptional activator